jgi:cation diffusion facilitator CzcD-associated flavoprotein CzcO
MFAGISAGFGHNEGSRRQSERMMASGKRVCVIGAGPSGLAAAKNAILAGLAVTVFEKNDKVGGNWVFNASTGHSSVYENTHIISSKALSEFEDFPMPADYPDYPRHNQIQAYFEHYARHFGVMAHIRFRHTVLSAVPQRSGGWQIDYTDADGARHSAQFDVLMVANGHHWAPKFPQYEGVFSGIYAHSHDFKGIDDGWRGQSVLVIGAGNSACDIAVEAARLAGKVCLSMRSPQWFVPKFMLGKPSDVTGAGLNFLPRRIKQWLMTAMLRITQGSYANYGLPVNKKPILSHHPTMNSDLLDFIRHGRIQPRPAIRRFDGDAVEFVDGRRERFDRVYACTGFWIKFPFFSPDLIDFQHAEKVPLYRKMIPADLPDLYFIGLFQPTGCIWPLADYQAMLACAEINGKYQRPADLAQRIQHEMANPHYRFDGGSRHATQVDYHRLRDELKADLRTIGIDIGKPPMGRQGHYKNWVNRA